LRRLKFLFLIYNAIFFLIFSIFCLEHGIAHPCVNIIFLLMAPAGYIYKASFLNILIAASWLVLFPLFILVYHIDPANSAFSIFVFNGLLIGFNRIKSMIKKEKTSWNARSQEKSNFRQRYENELKDLDIIENETRDKELKLVNIYEITKRMSGSLKFEDIFNILSTFLKENFAFRKAELVILKDTGTNIRTEGPYRVWADTESVGESGIDYNEIIKLFEEEKKELYFTIEEDADILEKLRLDSKVRTFACIPLLSENKIVGILGVENLPHIYLERVSILAMQFALEMKKVLLYETVEQLAITDGLTGLYVRRYFLERLDEELNRSRRYGLKFAFLMLDIDNFKNCNDTYGHLVGDVVLREVAQIMRQSVREIDLIARYGGEEFSLVLPETEAEGAKLAAERIRKKVEENIFKAYDEKLKITVSIGLSIYPEDSESAKDLIEKADEALYAAKRSGKNIVCLYNK